MKNARLSLAREIVSGIGLPIQADQNLLCPISKMELRLRDFASGGGQSVVHGDLHEQQFLVQNRQLIALLDFNESFIGRYEWDFGSYLYFHGELSLIDLLSTYYSTANEIRNAKANAWLAAILIALHHGNRAKVLNRPLRLNKSVAVLRVAVKACE